MHTFQSLEEKGGRRSNDNVGRAERHVSVDPYARFALKLTTYFQTT